MSHVQLIALYQAEKRCKAVQHVPELNTRDSICLFEGLQTGDVFSEGVLCS